jgi:hypothetical protein
MAALARPIAFFVAALAMAAPATAEMQPSTPEAIAAAAVDCWQAANGPALDEVMLQSRGWKAGSMTSGDGKPVVSPLRFYGRSESGVMLTAMNTADAAGCTILSRVQKPEDIGASAQLLMSRLQAIDPATKGTRQGQAIVYISGNRVAQLAPSGTMEKPSTTILIAYVSPEKK